ncbi:MAG: hypothetical protein D6737_08820 [Chloroflexi bacterium]|nr:MAG: hypothetical protein D6737_08820 [Chloroflexota bacterium]
MQVLDDHRRETLTPDTIAESYQRLYQQVNHRPIEIYYLSNQWYRVGHETVHRSTLLGEITRLRQVAVRKHVQSTDKSLVKKLIDKLRGL